MAERGRCPIRLVVADDHAIFRDGLTRLLETDSSLEVVGQAADGVEAVRLVRELAPDVLLLDYAMPKAGGLDVLRELAQSPGDTRIVVLTAAIERAETVVALQLGARGVVLKESASDLLFKCIRSVMAGEFWVGHEGVSDLVASLRRVGTGAGPGTPAARLTPRERQIVAAVVDGEPNKEIARRLGLSEQTVKNHLSSIYDKLGVSSRLELALYAVHHRLLEGTPGSPTSRGAR